MSTKQEKGKLPYHIQPAIPLLRIFAFLIDVLTIYTIIILSKFISLQLFEYEKLIWHPEAAAQDILILVSYFIIPTGFWGVTLGKWLAGIVVVNSDGDSPGIANAIPREIAYKVIAYAVFFIGIIWILFDAKRQGLHDKMAETYVVYNLNSPIARFAKRFDSKRHK